MTHEMERYLEAHIREALATDERTNILDAQVVVATGTVLLMGSVESQERRLAVEAVVREATPAEWNVVNVIAIDDFEAPMISEERI